MLSFRLFVGFGLGMHVCGRESDSGGGRARGWGIDRGQGEERGEEEMEKRGGESGREKGERGEMVWLRRLLWAGKGEGGREGGGRSLLD